MSLLDPFSHALAGLVAGLHTVLTSLGADGAAGATWLLVIAAVVVVVRTALLPLVAHSVRHARASALARPQLDALARRYRNRRDPASMRAFMEERRKVAAEHGMSRLGCLPLLLQLPVWLALYRLLADVAEGSPVGAVGADLVASLGAATVLGVPLASRGYLGAGWTHMAVVAGIAGATALLTCVTQKHLVAPNLVAVDLPEAVARAQHLMPWVSAVGLLLAGGVVPLAMLVYWMCNAVWTCGQAAVVRRWFPTPGSPAAARATMRT